MKLLSRIQVGPTDDPHSIELYEGDLTALPAEHAVDVLVVSAFPDDYLETRKSLVGALDAIGLSLGELASDKALDLRSERSCWLSRPLTGERAFGRILCFEPIEKGTPPERVDDIFDSLEQVLLRDYRGASVAMPAVGAGDMGWPIEEIIPALLDAAVARLRIGLPLKQLKIVELDPGRAALIQGLFQEFIAEHGAIITARPRRSTIAPRQDRSRGPVAAPSRGLPDSGALSRWALVKLTDLTRRALGAIGVLNYRNLPPHRPDPGGGAPAGSADAAAGAGWDCFVSYSRKDSALVDEFIEMVRSKLPDARIFRDSESLRNGSDWISVLADTIDSSRRFVAVFSPSYFDSIWCKRELNAAILRNDQGDEGLLYPIFLREDKTAPTLYLTFNYFDCREADIEKLTAASERLAALLQS